jgi:hypothetical protein
MIDRQFYTHLLSDVNILLTKNNIRIKNNLPPEVLNNKKHTMNKIPTLLIFLSAIIWFLLLQSCSYDNIEEYYTDICDTTDVTYSGAVLPVIDRNCNNCHFAGNSTGVDLETYINIKTAADNGSLLGSIKHQPGYTPMPLNGKLDDCTIAKLEKWINDGTPNN